MSEPIKMTEDELSEVRMLQNKFAERVQQFGHLYLEKMQVQEAVDKITKKEGELQNEWKNLQKLENDLIDKVIKKYGEGQLDLKAGVFIPEKVT
jgi:hypothetical protein